MVAQYMLNDVLNLFVYAPAAAHSESSYLCMPRRLHILNPPVCVCPFCVLENGGVSECYTRITDILLQLL